MPATDRQRAPRHRAQAMMLGLDREVPALTRPWERQTPYERAHGHGDGHLIMTCFTPAACDPCPMSRESAEHCEGSLLTGRSRSTPNLPQIFYDGDRDPRHLSSPNVHQASQQKSVTAGPPTKKQQRPKKLQRSWLAARVTIAHPSSRRSLATTWWNHILWSAARP